jgi:hypothetical protein
MKGINAFYHLTLVGLLSLTPLPGRTQQWYPNPWYPNPYPIPTSQRVRMQCEQLYRTYQNNDVDKCFQENLGVIQRRRAQKVRECTDQYERNIFHLQNYFISQERLDALKRSCVDKYPSIE